MLSKPVEEQVVLARNMATVCQGSGPGSIGTSFIPSPGGERRSVAEAC